MLYNSEDRSKFYNRYEIAVFTTSGSDSTPFERRREDDVDFLTGFAGFAQHEREAALPDSLTRRPFPCGQDRQ